MRAVQWRFVNQTHILREQQKELKNELITMAIFDAALPITPPLLSSIQVGIKKNRSIRIQNDCA